MRRVLSSSALAVAISVIASYALSENAGFVLLERGHRSYFQGQFEEAIRFYQGSFRAEPSIDAALNHAMVLHQLGRSLEAAGVLKKALPLDSAADGRIASALGWAYLSSGDPEKSGFWFAKAVFDEKEGAVSILGLALSHFMSERWKEAAKQLEDVIQREPRLVVAHYFLGRCYEKLQMPDKALEAYQKALKVDSRLLAVRFPLARLRETREEWDLAWMNYVQISQTDAHRTKALSAMDRIRQRRNALLSSAATVRTDLPSRVPQGPTRAVQPILDTLDLPSIRVGLRTAGTGVPIRQDEIRFQTAEPFELRSEKDPALVLRGNGGERWSVTLPGHMKYAEIRNGQKKLVGRFRQSIFIRQEMGRWRTIYIAGERSNYGDDVPEREVRGNLEIKIVRSRKTLALINHIPVEEYLYGVIAAEMPAEWPLEALKAQAVISRTLIAYRIRFSRQHRKFGYDICDDQHCQVYRGLSAETDKTRRAAAETQRKIVTYQGLPAHTVFTANCGGHTQNGEEVGWGSVPYWTSLYETRTAADHAPTSPWQLRLWLEEKPPLYCDTTLFGSPAQFRWTTIVFPEDIQNKVSKKRIGDLLALVPLERSAAGNIRSLLITGTHGQIILSKEHQVRGLLGLQSLRSTQFVVETIQKNGRPFAFLIFGGGWGHGVGLCQGGAAGRAQEGQTYDQILSMYYAGTRLDDWVPPGASIDQSGSN